MQNDLAVIKEGAKIAGVKFVEFDKDLDYDKEGLDRLHHEIGNIYAICSAKSIKLERYRQNLRQILTHIGKKLGDLSNKTASEMENSSKKDKKQHFVQKSKTDDSDESDSEDEGERDTVVVDDSDDNASQSDSDDDASDKESDDEPPAKSKKTSKSSEKASTKKKSRK